MNRRIWLAELTGTLVVVLLGCGSIVLAERGSISGMWVPAVFGAAVATMIHCFAGYGGAHFNPAVTLAFQVLGRKEAPLWVYLSAQFAGAVIACLALSSLFGPEQSYGAPHPSYSPWVTFAFEALGTFLIVLVILRVKILPLVSIGLTVGLVSWGIGPLSGGAFNPVRAAVPLLFSGRQEGLAIYAVAAFCGGLFAAGLIGPILLRARKPDLMFKNDDSGGAKH